MGDKSGIFEVARCYRNGIGVERDLLKANDWYRRARQSITVKYECASKKLDDDLKKYLIENKYQLAWIPYDEFEYIRKIGKGGFATVHYALWNDISQNLNTRVALKMLDFNNSLEFVKELKIFCEIRDVYPSFLNCYGISKNGDGKYILVLEYARKNSLSKNLIDISRMDWRNKIKLLQCIASDLDMIHFQGYIHRDLHSGNVLQDDIDNAYVADLGISSSAKSKVGGIYGVLPYIAPEVLFYQSFTQASDIYFLGIIMTEISTGEKPFDGIPFDNDLATKICLGLRPGFALGTPDCYVELAKQCMDSDPQKRPTASSIQSKLNEWNKNLNDQDENEIKKQFFEADEKTKELPIIFQKHPDHMYTSKHINTQEITNALVELYGSNPFDVTIPDDL